MPQKHEMDLRVGIHTGSAAGAVLGKLRAFYCIYGVTVNTASRLCKYADRCQIHCSAAFVQQLEAEHTSACGAAGAVDVQSRIRVQSRGNVLLKGFAESMETFVVTYEDEHQRAGAEQRLPSNETSYNVDAFTGAQALAAGATANATAKARGAGGDTDRIKDDPAADPLMSLLRFDDLSAESRAIAQLQDHKLINNNNKLALNERLVVSDRFLDTSIELQYKEQASQLLQQHTIAGIVWHLTGVSYQLFQVLCTGRQYDAEVLGEDLAAAYNSVSRLLNYHLATQSIVGVALAICLWRFPLRCGERMRMLLALMRVAWVCVSISASCIWPQKHYTIGFTMLFIMSQTFIVFGSFQSMALLYGIVNLLSILAIWSAEDIVPRAFVLRWVASSIANWMFIVWTERGNRRSWRLHNVFVTEMKRLNDILNDLLPLNLDGKSGFPGTAAVLSSAGYAEWAFWAQRRNSLNLLSGINTAHQREALVLQLDLCDFTQISSKTTPMQLARALHEMFSAFDTTVQRLNLFKMDTVGDAFIVAAWLPHRDRLLSDPRSRGRNKTTLIDLERERKEKTFETELCTKMMLLASTMLEAVNNAKCGSQRFTARIGIGTGKVVVGALGSLQPRMHIRGDGAKEAERLEASGTPGRIHVCDSFFDIMSSRFSANGSVGDIGVEVGHASESGGDCLNVSSSASSRVRRRTGSMIETAPRAKIGGIERRVSEVTHVSSIDVSLGGTWSRHRTGQVSDAGGKMEGGEQSERALLLEHEKRRQAEIQRLRDKVHRLLALASLNYWQVAEVKLDEGAGAPLRRASFVLDCTEVTS